MKTSKSKRFNFIISYEIKRHSFNRLWLILIHLLTLNYGAYCQLVSNNVTPPSPTVSAFNKYVDHRVSLATGTPEISIPLYEINVDGINIPISLSYHASGIQFGQNNGNAGVGWVLNPGYNISRTIYGLVDERFDKPTYQDLFNNLYSTSDKQLRDKYLSRFAMANDAQSYSDMASQPKLDGEYDIFTYSLDASSGKFLISDKASKKISFLSGPQKGKIDYSIGLDVNNSFNSIKDFSFTDIRGIKYFFGKDLSTGAYLNETIGRNEGRVSTAWPLTKVESIHGREIIFKYAKFSQLASSRPYGEINLLYSTSLGGGNCFGNSKTETTINPPASYYDVFWPTEIVTPHETITYTYTNGRISNIKVRNNNADLIREINFSYVTGIKHVFLNTVEIKGSGTENMKYVLGYNGIDQQYTNYDYFGFNATAPSSVYFQQYDFMFYPNTPTGPNGCNGVDNVHYSLSNPKTSYPSAYILNKVTYPTGGYSEYLYENANYVASSVSFEKGVRIREIKNYDSSAKLVNSKLYFYGKDRSGKGTASTTIPGTQQGLFEVENAKLVYAYDRLYARVKSKTYRSIPNEEVTDAFVLANLCWNDIVEEVESDAGAPNGKKIYFFQNSSMDLSTYQSPTGSELFLPMIRTFDYTMGPNLTKTETYKKVGTTFSMVKKTINKYAKAYPEEFGGIKVRPYATSAALALASDDFYTMTGLDRLFSHSEYSVSGGISVLESVLDTVYTDGSKIATKLSYVHGRTGNILTEDYASSNEKSWRKQNRYPDSYTLDAPVSNDIARGIKYLQDRNILTPVVETFLQVTDTVSGIKSTTGATLAVYNVTAPTLKETYHMANGSGATIFNGTSITSASSVIDNRYRLENKLEQYDSYGNILQQKKGANSVSYAYIWGYKGRYPIAEAVNATYNDIAFTGFEEGDSGGWTWTGQVVTGNTSSYDGENFLGLSSGQSISKTGLTAAKKYRVSVWLWGSTAPSGYTAVATKGAWTNYEKIVTGLTTFTLTYAESINGMVDNISICPLDALMTTYTYKPLVGMATKTDTRGLTEYYEYDSFGRLSLIKDFNGHILKDFRYHYKP